ncbi:UDP-N-acetylmuramoyl-L-alanyl-D-glutamate--2,6-diaminopimelate ligase [Thalassobacillus sp. CUG 92003]|uniref:UDP-N-acetylmuramoyl-L-alanyl-D-glutamate--2, 6-diaminopimelate ligase n=1 Tax=Thalassobacillus sp. CUG 92003 TaxID=2736641 RepID=UPI0015E6B6D7|nr:UDP-N-acetylmuramoyl-L-alanyl-D-glutamate--2,6-diaminopimelate ligase [Thalassobacillus sp. CUG 92003]
MTFKELLTRFPTAKVIGELDGIKVTGVSMDSRTVQPGNLFICIRGDRFDGHDFVMQARDNGAAVIVAEEAMHIDVPVVIVPDTVRAMALISDAYYQQPTKNLNLIGVTGTNGKTSVTYLLDEIFRRYNQKTALIGTIHMKIGDDVYPVKNTTPDSLFLQQSFHTMVKEGIQTAIMEVSSHALTQGRVYGCDFNIAVFTNLSQDHLDYHESMEEYFRAKSLLFSQLGNTYDPKLPKRAIINLDSPYAKTLIRSTAQPVLTYGIESEADVRAQRIHLHEKGSVFELVTSTETVMVRSPLIGKFSVYNMLAAAAAALVSDVPLLDIKKALETSQGVRGRFEPVEEGQDFGVIIDYSHTPDSLHNVVKTLKEFCDGSVRVVVGCGGDRDRTKRSLMAEVAINTGDEAIFTSDNPRSEDPESIINDMVENLNEPYHRITDREKAIEFALKNSKAGDMVLIAGKGHETYQEINGVRTEFDDREVARKIIKQMKGL